MLTHIDLFSGIGGFALAARWAGFRTLCFVEIDEYCRRVIEKNFGAVLAGKWATDQTSVASRTVRSRRVREAGDVEYRAKNELASMRGLRGSAEICTNDLPQKVANLDENFMAHPAGDSAGSASASI